MNNIIKDTEKLPLNQGENGAFKGRIDEELKKAAEQGDKIARRIQNKEKELGRELTDEEQSRERNYVKYIDGSDLEPSEKAAELRDKMREEAEAALKAHELQHAPPISDDWDFVPPPQEWIIKDWLPRGRVATMNGRGGVGKTRLVLQLATGVAAGETQWLEGGPSLEIEQAETVVYVSYEDTRDQIRSRFPANISPSQIQDRFKFISGADPLWIEGTATDFMIYLLKQCSEVGATLLVIDPLSAAYLDNENDRGQVRRFLHAIDSWSRKNNCTVLLIAHPSKDTQSDYSGSTDWVNGVRAVLTMGKKTTTKKGTPRRKATGSREIDDYEAVCLECYKSSYGKIPKNLWLKSEYPTWKATSFMEAAVEQMTDDEIEEERIKRGKSLEDWRNENSR